jgi:hypothetical protein
MNLLVMSTEVESSLDSAHRTSKRFLILLGMTER